MGLRLIIGPAGSGKTQYIIDSVINDLVISDMLSMHPILIVVPDQATFQMEKAILEDGRLDGFINLHILGFRRLCLRVLDEVGGVTRPFITPVGRSMAIQSILWDHRDRLSVYGPMVDYPGFRETIIQALSEFNAYDVMPGDLKLDAEEQDKEPPFLSQKLNDLELIYCKYQEFLEDNFLDPDDYLELAAARMHRSSLVRDASVWIDGFSGFTPKEYKVISSMLNSASQVSIALCMDHEEIQHKPRETSLFHPVREVYENVLEICQENGVPIEETIVLGEQLPLPRFESRELSQIEYGFRHKERRTKLSFDRLTPETENDINAGSGHGELSMLCCGVELVAAVNPRAEVEFVAREILKLVREQGLRFRDITLELRNLERYKELIEITFQDHGIPFFLDQKRSLSHHPLAELIRSAFDIVLTDFGFDSVFRYLKTDLVPLKREWVDQLENYVLACGIRGKRWISQDPWQYTKQFISDEDEPGTVSGGQRIDQIRREAMDAFSKFYYCLKTPGSEYSAVEEAFDADDPGQAEPRLTAKDISMAVYNLLLELNVPKTLSGWQEDCESQGDLISALEHAGVWDKTLEILEQAVEILGEQPCDVRTYSLLLNAGLEDIRLGAIPPSLDQVLIGNLDRTRQPKCEVTFLLGALEGDFPKKQVEEGIFTDKEREMLLRAGLNLEPSSRIRQLHEQYLVYIALTRPQKALYISYPLGDRDGKAVIPSSVIGWVKSIMPHKQERLVSMDPPGTYPEDLDYLAPATLWSLTARRLSLMRQGIYPGIVWEEAYRWMLEPSRAAKSRRILSSLGYSNKIEQLGEVLSGKLYGSPLITSVSRLERFQQCPFQHFARDGLGLREREVFELDPLKAGNFFHEAMREFILKILSCGQHVEQMEQQDVIDIMDEVVQQLVPKIQNELFLSSFRYKHVSQTLGSVLRRSAVLFLEHMQRSEFRPLAVEVPFGLAGGVTPYSVNVPGHGEVLIRGRIDRVDVAKLGSDLYVRIVDYKSSQSNLDLLEIHYGLSLQLLVYLCVVLSKWDEIVQRLCVLQGTVRAVEEETQANNRALTPLPAGAVYLVIDDPFIKEDGPIDSEAAWIKQKKKLKMTGALVDDLEVLRLMDGTSSGSSDILPVYFTKAGNIGSSSKTVAGEDLNALLTYVLGKVSQISAEIISGRIDIEPFRRNQLRACTYCAFGPLCTFDVLVEGNQYKIFESVSRERIWDEIRELPKEEKSSGSREG